MLPCIGSQHHPTANPDFLIALKISKIRSSFILIFSEITPKTMAAVKPEKFATFSSFFLKILLYVFKPIIKIINSVSSVFLKLFRLNLKDAKNNDNLNTEELKTLLEESGNLIPKQFRSVLSSVLEMDELIVEDSILVDNNLTKPIKQIVIKGILSDKKIIRKWSLQKI